MTLINFGAIPYLDQINLFHKQLDLVEVRDYPKIYQGHKMSEIPA